MNDGIRSFFVMFTLLYDGAYEGLAQLRANIEVVAAEEFIKHATPMDIMELEYLQHKFLEEKDTDLISCIKQRLVVGMGEIIVEAFKDASLYPCPINRAEAMNMLQKLKAYKMLTGCRGSAPCDVDAVKPFLAL